MKNKLLIFTTFLSAFLGFAVFAHAHVVVKPSEVGIGSFQTFTMGVPNEKDSPTVEVRLLIPEGLASVSPNVKPGWKITIKKSGEEEEAQVTEIDWTGGSIPVGQRDDFLFSAQVPAQETTVNWKAYQTYSDGTIVSWDQDPANMKNLTGKQKEENEQKGMGASSQTIIMNDLKETPKEITQNSPNPIFSYAALGISVVALGLSLSKKNT